MSDQLEEIGARIRASMPAGMSQRDLAQQSVMKPDALSRALNGLRGFSAQELARVAEVLGVETHWLITGDVDPHRVQIAARHGWNADARRRVSPDLASDEEHLERVTEAYRTAYPLGPPPSVELPSDPESVRSALGEGFARDFAALAEERLGVDVVRITGLSTAYSLRIGERGVVLLPASPRWFRSNWSLAHEIGHLALQHHNGAADSRTNERPADNFAANLLLPRALVQNQDWQTMNSEDVAIFVWTTGVSTEALRNRLDNLRVVVPEIVAESLAATTPRLLRVHATVLDPDRADDPSGNPLTLREQDAASHRFPVSLVTALQERVEAGAANPELLAWALNVSVDEVDFPEPDDIALAEAHERMLADRPSIGDWQARATQTEHSAR